MEKLFEGQAFRLEKNSAGVGFLVFDLKGEKVNKLGEQAMRELQAILERVGQGTYSVKALVLKSAKSQSFIVGADINQIRALRDEKDAEVAVTTGQKVFDLMEDLPMPTMAAIEGPCMGGATELALACQYRVVSDHEKTAIALPEVKLGFLPGWGGTYRLPKKIGLPNALDMILTGKNIRPDKAVKMGLADVLIPAGLFDQTVESLGQALAEGKKLPGKKDRKVSFQDEFLESFVGRKIVFSKARQSVLKETRGHYPAPLAILDHLEESWGLGRGKFLAKEAARFVQLWQTPESKSLVDLFFLMEGNKKETGTSLSEAQIRALPEAKNIAVLGAGVMGGGVAFTAASRGLRTLVKDLQMDAVAKALAHARKLSDGELKKKRIDAYERDRRMNRIRGQVDFSGFTGVDLVIEAVVEDLGVKNKVFAELEKQVPKSTIIATNTSSLRMRDMVASFQNPERFVGLHFFNPVHKMPLVEVVVLPTTSPEVIARSVNFVRAIGKTPVVCQDGPGFLVNRLLLPHLNEAGWALQEGHRIDFLDQVTKNFGLPMGACELLDEIGLDVACKVGHILHDSLGERFKPADVLDKIVAANKKDPSKARLGRKNGLGFYVFDRAGGLKQKIDQAGIDHLIFEGKAVPAATATTMEAMARRLIFPMINEAAVLLQEKIAASAQDVDLAMIFGTGFPPFRGGLLKYADRIGLDKVVAELERMSVAHGPRLKPSKALLDFAKGPGKFYS